MSSLIQNKPKYFKTVIYFLIHYKFVILGSRNHSLIRKPLRDPGAPGLQFVSASLTEGSDC